MKKRMAALLLALVPAAALASSGGLDANGGHYDHSTGLYHYHHGYPAHQHENGICPYTGEVWELKVPERPAKLSDRNAKKQSGSSESTPSAQPVETVESSPLPAPEETAVPEPAETEIPVTAAPESTEEAAPAAEMPTEAPDESRGTRGGGSALPAAAGAAVAAGGAFALYRRRKKRDEAEIQEEEEIDSVIPEDTVIGEDGLPWEEAAHDAWLKRKQLKPHDHSVPTSKSEPKWGPKYTFYLDGDGSEIHTRDCPTAFIQINAADPNCPVLDCPKCHPARPDLKWFEDWKARQEGNEDGKK